MFAPLTIELAGSLLGRYDAGCHDCDRGTEVGFCVGDSFGAGEGGGGFLSKASSSTGLR